METKVWPHNLRSLYVQRSPDLILKPNTLLLCFSENGFPPEFFSESMKLKILLPVSFRDKELKVYSNYIQVIPKEYKGMYYLNDNYLKTGRTVAIDMNYAFYRIHNIMYRGNNKLNKKLMSYYAHGLNEVFNPDVFKKYGYKNVVFNYQLDVSNMKEKIKKSDLKSTLLGVIAFMIKSKDYSFSQKQIVLTIKNKLGVSNILIYKEGHEFNISRVLQIINSYIISEEDELKIQEKIDQIYNRLKSKLKDKGENYIAIAIDAIQKFISQHVDEISAPIDKIIYEAIVSELEDNNINTSKTKNISKLLDKLIKIKPNPIIISNESEPLNFIFNESKILGNSLNFRRATMEKHLIHQIRGFDEYFEKMYGVRTDKITLKTISSKSIYGTKYDRITIHFKDKKGKEFKLSFDLPHGLVQGDPYIDIDGVKRTLIYQLYQDPVMNPVPFESIVKTNYASVTISSETKNKNRGIYVYALGKKLSYLEFIIASIISECEGDCKEDCFKYALKQSGVDGRISVSTSPKNEYAIKIGEKYYVVENTDKNKQIVQSFITELKSKDFDSCNEIKSKIETKFSQSFIKSANQLKNNMIDPTVKFILRDKGKNLTTFDLYNEAVNNAISGIVTSQIDLNRRRLRSSEVLAVAIFKKINPAIQQYSLTGKEPKINSNTVLQELLVGSLQTQFQKIKTQNPLSEIAYATKVTYSGLNGIVPRNAPLGLRGVDDTFYGIIDPIDTPDSDAVGVTRHLAVSSKVKSISGKFDLYSMNVEINPLSIVSNYSPIPISNDGNRLQFVASQLKSDLPLEKSEIPLVMSSYSDIPIHLASDSFVIKSPISGKVIEVGDSYIVISSNKGKPKVIHFNKHNINDSDSIVTKAPIVKVGDVVQENQPIVASKEFFSMNNLKMGLNAYTVIKPHNVANFEDGIVVSESFANKAVSTHGYKIPVFIKEDEIITEIVEFSGEPVTINKSSILISKGTAFEESTSILIESNDEFETTIDESILSDDEDSNSESIVDVFNSNVVANIDSELYDIEIYAKSIDILKKYPELFKIWQSRLKSIENKLAEFKSKKYDVSALEEEYEKQKNIFGRTFKGNKIENVLVIFNLKALKKLKIGDKLHNRHGKQIAA